MILVDKKGAARDIKMKAIGQAQGERLIIEYHELRQMQKMLEQGKLRTWLHQLATRFTESENDPTT